MADSGSGSDGDVLERVAATIAARQGADPTISYVAALFAKGDDAILKKIGEEATETVMAAKDGEGHRIVSEVADLWFHCLVLLVRHGLTALTSSTLVGWTPGVPLDEHGRAQVSALAERIRSVSLAVEGEEREPHTPAGFRRQCRLDALEIGQDERAGGRAARVHHG